MRGVLRLLSAVATWGVPLLIVGALIADPLGDPSPAPPSDRARAMLAIADGESIGVEHVQCVARNADDGLYRCTAAQPLPECLDLDELELALDEPLPPDERAALESIRCGGSDLRRFDAAVDLGTGDVSYEPR